MRAAEGRVDRVKVGVDAVVDELVGAEADPGAEHDKEARVPVDDDEDVDDQVDDADRVREAALCLHPVEELQPPPRTDVDF